MISARAANKQIKEEEEKVHQKQQQKGISGTSQDLLFQRHQKDILEVFEQRGIDIENGFITEVQLVELMQVIGYVRSNNNEDINAVNALWVHLRPGK